MADVVFFSDQKEFSDWLEKYHGKSSELWVGYFRKSTGRASLTWSTSVDAALCFGWIDGIRKTIDEQSYKIRFTPRKTTSVWSAVNVKKVKALIQLGKMKRAGLQLIINLKPSRIPVVFNTGRLRNGLVRPLGSLFGPNDRCQKNTPCSSSNPCKIRALRDQKGSKTVQFSPI